MNERSFIARIFLWKRFSSFTYLNLTQFLVTINDSIFRMLVAFYLIDKLGTDQSSNILFVSGILFVVPFLIFSMPAGELADKYSKMKVIVWTLVLEILAMLYGIYAMMWCSEFNAYAALFFVALQAAIFLPSKYAILPEIVKKEELSKANGFMTLATYVAIIAGTFLASFFTQVTNNNYVAVAIFCLFIAILGFFTSLQIETTPVKNAAKKVKILFLVQVYKSLKLAKQYPHLVLTLFAGAFFLYTASFTQLNIIPFGISALKITDVQAGYVLLAAALGMGIGSLVVAIVSGKNVELGISILGAFGTSFSYIILGLFPSGLTLAIAMILSLGIHGGLFIVPIDAFIQIASPEKDRGEIVAAGSFLGFLGIFLAALTLGFFTHVLKISPASGYLFIGISCLIVSVIITFFLPEYFSRILAVTFFKSFFHIEVRNQPQTSFYESLTIICRKYSLLKVLCLIYLYPRIVFIKFTEKKPFFLLKPLYLLLHIRALPTRNKSLFKDQIKKLVDKKLPLCVFLENEDSSYQQNIESFFSATHLPSIFLHIEKNSPPKEKRGLFGLFRAFVTEVETSFSEKISDSFNYSKAQETMKRIESQKANC